MRKFTPAHVQNTAVEPSWGQLWREILCAIKGHVFYVAWGLGYLGLPQAHCYRCGKKGAGASDYCKDWEEPIG